MAHSFELKIKQRKLLISYRKGFDPSESGFWRLGQNKPCMKNHARKWIFFSRVLFCTRCFRKENISFKFVKGAFKLRMNPLTIYLFARGKEFCRVMLANFVIFLHGCCLPVHSLFDINSEVKHSVVTWRLRRHREPWRLDFSTWACTCFRRWHNTKLNLTAWLNYLSRNCKYLLPN